MRRGFTLVECELAAAVLALSAVVLLGGIPLATRIATENAQLLAADSLAWDAAWKTFNVASGSLPAQFNEEALTIDRTGFDPQVNPLADNSKVQVYELPEKAAPALYVSGSPAVLLVAVVPTPATNDVVLLNKMDLAAHNDDFPQHRRIYVDVEWGAAEHRTRLSDYHTIFVDRSARSRVPWEVQ